jgi:hypothetical protein
MAKLPRAGIFSGVNSFVFVRISRNHFNNFVISTLFLFRQISGPPGVGTMHDANRAFFMSARMRSNIHFSSGRM